MNVSKTCVAYKHVDSFELFEGRRLGQVEGMRNRKISKPTVSVSLRIGEVAIGADLRYAP